MTEESICVRCVKLIRMKVETNDGRVVEERICSLGGVKDTLMSGDTVKECSRYVEVPGDEAVCSHKSRVKPEEEEVK